MSKLYYLDLKDIADNLESTDQYKVLSANQGNVLNTALGNKQDELIAGANINITGNTISAVNTTYTAGSNITISDNTISATDTTYSVATTTTDGLMSSTDKVKLDNTSSSLTGDINYYVATTGSDTNNGTSSSTPFQTIQHAIDILPKHIDGNVNIEVAEGTYNENVEIVGFSGSGSIELAGATDRANSVNYNLSRIIITKNSLNYVLVRGFNFTDTTDASIYVSFCSSCIEIRDHTLSSSSPIGIGIFSSDRVRIYSCLISNKSSSAISMLSMSRVNCDTISGTNNTYGYYTGDGSILHYSSSQLSATTLHLRGYASLVINDAGNIVT